MQSDAVTYQIHIIDVVLTVACKNHKSILISYVDRWLREGFKY